MLPQSMDNKLFLSEEECHELVVAICRQLDGIPVANAHGILEKSKRLISSVNLVDAHSSRFEEVIQL